MVRPFLKAAEIGTQGAQTLPARFFTSGEIFQLEQEQIFASRWICAARQEKLARAGDFVVRDFANDSVIIVRDEADQLRAHYNVCRHRGARLCSQPLGQFAKRIHCPYHSWSYSLDGRLLGAPSMEAAAGFEKDAYPLVPVALATWEGFVLLSLSPHPEPFDSAYASILRHFSRFGMPQLRSVRQIQYDVQANWKLIFQNYSECYHCPTVHPSLVQLSPADSGENDLTAGPFLGGFMAILRPAGSMSLSGQSCGPPIGNLAPEDRQRVYYYSIFPNMLLSLHHDYVMVHTLWPQAPNRTRIECQWLFHPAAIDNPQFRPEDAVQFWDTTNRQDWHVCELSQQGVASRGYRPAPYSPRESLLAAFDREYLTALNIHNPSTFSPEASR